MLTISPTERIVSAGSGFAPHLARRLRDEGFAVVVAETAHPIVPDEMVAACGYGVYAARYGEIYTSRQLLQLLRRAVGRFAPSEDVWERDGRYVDPFRPAIQPQGFATRQEYNADRRQHLAAVRQAFETMEVFVFTFGLSACWASRVDGAVYPVRPGLVNGHVAPDCYELLHLSTEQIADDMRTFITELAPLNPRVKIILTVSPAPVAAGDVVSTPETEALLCAAAQELERLPGVAFVPVARAATHNECAEQVVRLLRQSSAVALQAPSVERRQDAFLAEMGTVVDAICDDRWSEDTIKCVVWDLDNTVWQGVLVEGDPVCVRPGIQSLLDLLDRHGIVSSIASRSDERLAVQKLVELGLHDYFLYPQIGWGSKASSIRRIAELLNIGLDAMAFVDDQPFERDEVSYVLPQVTCIDACDIDTIPTMPRMSPRFVTEDARSRRARYVCDARRHDARREFAGSDEEFLGTLQIVLTLARMTDSDLHRAEELTVRTHQLNSSGRTYSYDELDALRTSPRHLLLMASLADRYGPYGKIGLCVVERDAHDWTIRLLLMSCRVLSRGVEGAFLHHVMSLAKDSGVRLRADFVPTDRNQPMHRAFTAAGFQPIRADGPALLLEHTLDRLPPHPPHVRTSVEDLTVTAAR